MGESAVVSVFTDVELEVLALDSLEVVIVRGLACGLWVLDERDLVGGLGELGRP